MNKLLVTIYVPFIEQHYDLFIPTNKKLYDILKLSLETISKLTNDTYKITNKEKFVNKETGLDYDLNKFVNETDIKNGTSLILI